MAQPPSYAPAHEFVADEAVLNTLPGSELDIEFNSLKTTLDALLANIALIQRDDGALENGIVGTDALSSELAAVLGDPTSLAEFQALVTAAEAAEAAALASQTAAAASQTAAASSASSASTSASTATTQASAATTQASNAAASAVAAAAAAASVAFKFTWSTSTSGDPGSGKIAVNNASPGSATAFQISETDANSNNLATEIARWDDATNSAGKARIKIAKDATNFLLLTLTSAVTDNGAYDSATVSGAVLTGSLANGDTVYVTVYTAGNDGAGTGDASTNTSSSVDGEMALFSGTAGKTLKRSTLTGGMLKSTSGVPAIATAGTDYLAPPAGTSILKGNSGGALANAAAGTDYVAPGGALGTPSSGTLTNCTGLPAAGLVASTSQAVGFGSVELGHASDTTLSRASAGVIAVEGVSLYPNLPQTSKSAAYTTVLADANTALLHPSADTTARTFTIDSNANVAYPVGTTLTFINQASAGVLTIAITTDTMRLSSAGTTGSRTLAANGIATAVKLTSTEWIINGTGLT